MFWLRPPQSFASVVTPEFLIDLRIVPADAPYDTEVVDTPLTGTAADADLVEHPTDDAWTTLDPVTNHIV